MVHQDGNVSLHELRDDKFISINTSKKFKRFLIILIKKNYSTLYQLEKSLAIGNLQPFLFNNKTIKLYDLNKIIKKFKIPFRRLEKNINWLGTKTGYGIKNPKIPFNFKTTEGFKFIASILGDGSISNDLLTTYNNQEPLLVENIKKSAIKIFGNVKGITKSINKEEVITLRFPRIIGRIILKLGLVPGRKTVTNPKLPKFILNSTTKNKIEFLKQISDDEGSAQINIPYSYSIRFEFSVQVKIGSKPLVSNLIIDLHNLVSNLDYNTTRIYNAGIYECKGKNKGINRGYQWAFDILGKDSITRFYNEVGFRVKSKQIKLLKGIQSIKRNQLGTKKMYEAAIKNFKIVHSKEGFVTKHNLAKQANISLRNSQEWLRKLYYIKKLIKIKNKHNFIHSGDSISGFRGRTPNEYILIK